MKMHLRRRLSGSCLAAMLAAVFLTACTTAYPPRPTRQLNLLAHPEPVVASGVFVHKASSMTFQPSIQDLRRTEILRNDVEGLDVSVTYSGRIVSGPVLMTVHVYPEPWVVGEIDPAMSNGELKSLCGTEFEGAKQALARQYTSARLINEAQLVRTYSGKRITGGRADYEMTADFRGQRQRIGSIVLVSCMGWTNWVVSIRATGPVRVDLARAIDVLDQGMEWPSLPAAP